MNAHELVECINPEVRRIGCIDKPHFYLIYCSYLNEQ